MKLATVDGLAPTELRCFRDARGALVPVDLPAVVPFAVVRLFWVYDVPAGTSRGSHAHKECHQFLVCVAGTVAVEAYDGSAERSFVLTEGQALHLPPGIFATERYVAPGSVLMVFCDRSYEPADYLTEREAFLAYRRQMQPG
ncbi:MAG TPA: FdtA/QdtA family cupin domain-containing protein [Stellaceae bacterium]|jgi:dTDP-4-dehydrorhamnose 3,5-epimerase-like enzyme|nr:FdtA/QdtA family cupin domain-containing protein [Stellaceae bacterium]